MAKKKPSSEFARLRQQTRRTFLGDCQVGLGALALSTLMAADSTPAVERTTNPLQPRDPHFRPRARRVIYLHLTGSPPHLDLYDYKPELVRLNGQDAPRSFI